MCRWTQRTIGPYRINIYTSSRESSEEERKKETKRIENRGNCMKSGSVILNKIVFCVRQEIKVKRSQTSEK